MNRVGLVALCVAACATQAPVAYPLHPSLRSASGGPIAIVGEVAHPGVVPYATGITLTCALRLTGGPTSLSAHSAHLRRGGHTWGLPLDRIVDGTAPDLELAPGDVIVVEAIEI